MTNKKNRQRRGEADGPNQLKIQNHKSTKKAFDNDAAKIQPFHGCRKWNDGKGLFFYFSFFS